MTIRVLLADDQALRRATFRALIDSCGDMEVIGEVSDGREAVELAHIHHPDIVLMDIRMAGTDGLIATAAICNDPGPASTRVLVLTTVKTMARGFLGKDVTVDELHTGIRTVACGETPLSSGAPRPPSPPVSSPPAPPVPSWYPRPYWPNSRSASARSWRWPPRAGPTTRSPTCLGSAH